MHKIISTHCGIFEISHLMNDPKLVLESEIGGRIIDRIWKKKACRLDSNMTSIIISWSWKLYSRYVKC